MVTATVFGPIEAERVTVACPAATAAAAARVGSGVPGSRVTMIVDVSEALVLRLDPSAQPGAAVAVKLTAVSSATVVQRRVFIAILTSQTDRSGGQHSLFPAGVGPSLRIRVPIPASRAEIRRG